MQLEMRRNSNRPLLSIRPVIDVEGNYRVKRLQSKFKGMQKDRDIVYVLMLEAHCFKDLQVCNKTMPALFSPSQHKSAKKKKSLNNKRQRRCASSWRITRGI